MRKLYALTNLAIVGIAIMSLVGIAQADQNLALYGTATESSIYADAYADAVARLAIDGNTNGNYYDGSVAHTLNTYPSWWQVNLGATDNLNQIVLWNRTDGGWGSRLTNFYVSVLDTNLNVVWTENFYTSVGTFMPTSMAIDLPDGTTGEIVKVGLNDPGYLQLAEVQVFGTDPPISAPEPATMLLLGLGLVGLVGVRRKFKN